MSDFEAKYA